MNIAQMQAFCEAHITAGHVPGTGKKGIPSEGIDLAQCLRTLITNLDTLSILDVGCGNGTLAWGLWDTQIKYHGIDILEGVIDFCREAFVSKPTFQFTLIDVKSTRYHSRGKVTPKSARFPVPDQSYDLIVARSLFTHFTDLTDVEHYLDEFSRMLKPDSYTFTTWFTSPPNQLSSDTARAVFLDTDIHRALTSRLGKITWESGGLSTSMHDQRTYLTYA